MRGLRRFIVIPIAVVWLLATRGLCEAQSESDLAKASQNPVANMVSFPVLNVSSGGGLGSKSYLLLNVQPVMPLPVDERWLFVSRTVVPYVNTPLGVDVP
jgi:hypothetical protein